MQIIAPLFFTPSFYKAEDKRKKMTLCLSLFLEKHIPKSWISSECKNWYDFSKKHNFQLLPMNTDYLANM